jgi:hypothetical protein
MALSHAFLAALFAFMPHVSSFWVPHVAQKKPRSFVLFQSSSPGPFSFFDLFKSTTGPSPVDIKKETLLSACRLLNRGNSASKDQKADIETLIDELILSAPSPSPKFAEVDIISDNWTLVYTTEVELLSLMSDEDTIVTQEINRSDGTLQNFVGFKNGVEFTVQSSLSGSGVRSTFSFSGARLTFPNRFSVPLPPIGKGWFDNLFVDSTIRVVREGRGNTAVYIRAI